MPDAYEVYCQWCRNLDMKPPTRKWWDEHVTMIDELIVEFEPDFDYSLERKHWEEDWSNGS